MSRIVFLFILSLLSLGNTVEIDLSQHESSFYSPNGEDGLFARIFSALKPQGSFCVDCGANDGITNSLTYLLRNQGWRAVLFDRIFEIPALSLHKEFVTTENINALFQKYHVPERFDLLTIDTHYNDFYIWQAVEDRYQPSVVCIAYNAMHKPTEDKIVIAHPYYCGDDTDYFGASILSLYLLGRAKGYSLIYAEQSGRHLFFIRDEAMEKNGIVFTNANQVEMLYRLPDHANGKYRKDPKQRKYITAKEALKK